MKTITLDEATIDKIAERLAELMKTEKPAAEEQVFWGNKEVAEYYNVTDATVIKWYKDGILPKRVTKKQWLKRDILRQYDKYAS